MSATGYTLTPFSTDANGFTVIPTSSAGTLYFAQSGNDSTGDGSQAHPYKTLAKLVSLATAQTGTDRHYALKCGDTWTEIFGGWAASGASHAAPMVLTNWGTGARPIIKSGSGNGIFIPDARNLHDFWIVGLDFYCNVRDPVGNPGEYNPAVNDPTGIFWIGGANNILIEDCRFRFYPINVTIQKSTYALYDVRLRKNEILDAWGDSTPSIDRHSSGLFVSQIDQFLVEGNTLDHNGWNSAYATTVPTGNPTKFNHNAYLYYITNATITGNISSRASSFGFKPTSEHSAGCVNVLITGNLICGCGNGMSCDTNTATLTDYYHQTVTISGNVFTEMGRVLDGVDNSWGIQITSAENVDIPDNYFIHKSFAGNGSELVLSGFPKLNISFTPNIIHGWAGENIANNPPTGTNVVTTPNDISAIDWPRNVGTYDTLIGGPGTSDDFLTRARNQTKATWDTTLTASAVINNIVGSTPPPASTIEIVAGLLPSPAPTGTSWSVTDWGLKSAIVGGRQVVGGSAYMLPDASPFLTTAENVGVQVGNLLTRSIATVGNTQVVTHTHQNAVGVYTYMPVGDVMLVQLAVTNTHATLSIPNICVAAQNATWPGVPSRTTLNQPPSWYHANGGLENLHPSLTSQLGFGTMASNAGAGAWGLGLGTLVESRSAWINEYSANAAATTWGIRYLADVESLAPGQTFTLSYYLRVSANTSATFLNDPYRLWLQHFHPQQFTRDDRSTIYCFAAPGAPVDPITNPYNFDGFRRFDLPGTPGVADIVHRLVPNMSSTGAIQGMIIWNLTGNGPDTQPLIYPYFDLLPAPIAANVAALVAGFNAGANGGELLGCSTRPDKVFVSGTSGPLRSLDPNDSGEVSAMLARFTWAVAQGFHLFYADEFGSASWHVGLMEQIRETVGTNVRIYCEYINDMIAIWGGSYVPVSYINGQHVFVQTQDDTAFLTPQTLALLHWVNPGLAITGKIWSTAPNPLTTLEWLGQNKVSPMQNDYNFSSGQLAAFAARFLDPLLHTWLATPIGNPLDYVTPTPTPPSNVIPTIATNAAGPAKAATDGVTVEQPKLSTQIAADQYVKAAGNAVKRLFGLGARKQRPPNPGDVRRLRGGL